MVQSRMYDAEVDAVVFQGQLFGVLALPFEWREDVRVRRRRQVGEDDILELQGLQDGVIEGTGAEHEDAHIPAKKILLKKPEKDVFVERRD